MELFGKIFGVLKDWRIYEKIFSSKLFALCELESPHTWMELFGKIFGVLKDWRIYEKIFSLTLDNASSNDGMQNILNERLNLKNGLLCDSDFFFSC